MSEHHASRLLTLDEAAAYLATTPRWVRSAWQRRAIPAVKVGRAVRFDPADLDAFIQAHRVEAVREVHGRS